MAETETLTIFLETRPRRDVGTHLSVVFFVELILAVENRPTGALKPRNFCYFHNNRPGI